jgi:hypothetical protein
MRQSTIAVSGPLTVIIDHVEGDLQVAGWDRAEVSAKTDGKEFDLRVEGDKAYARSVGDLILYLPREANLQTGNISGDADIRAVSGNTRIENVAGDLQMRAVGPVTLNNVGGDLSVRGCAGDFSAEHIGSDASLRDVQGNLKLSMVGSDLYLRNTSANIQAQTGADAILYLQPKPVANVTIKARADILLRLPATVDAELSLQGGSMESIRVDFAGVEPGEAGVTRKVKLGSGTAKIRLTAGGDLIVTSRADEWQSLADFDSGGLDEMFPGRFPDISAHLHEHISQQIQEATQNAQRHRERTERRVEAAMRRAEEKMRASERRSKFMGVVVGRVNAGRPPSPTPPPAPPAPISEPVSDAERLAVLKMLQDKKISLQDAEKLLAALEGK